MKFNSKTRKKSTADLDDGVDEYDEPEKWYEQVRIFYEKTNKNCRFFSNR